jgi:hypothetical protein
MLSHRQNLRPLGSRRSAGSGEAQSRERVNFIKKTPCILKIVQIDNHHGIYKVHTPRILVKVLTLLNEH